MKKIELRLKELRKERNLSQGALAETLGISRQSVISLERGEFLPSLPLFIELVNFFELPFEQIVYCEGMPIQKGGEETMPRDITPWSPIREISTLHEAIDRMFEDSFLGSRQGAVSNISVPAINVRETENAVVVEAEIPGVKEEDLDVEVSDETLTIRGEKKIETETKEKDYYHREFSYGSFSRSIPLPVAVESDKAEAELKNGTLRITLPKVQEEKPKAKKINIKK